MSGQGGVKCKLASPEITASPHFSASFERNGIEYIQKSIVAIRCHLSTSYQYCFGHTQSKTLMGQANMLVPLEREREREREKGVITKR